jgi:hypothetical protein
MLLVDTMAIRNVSPLDSVVILLFTVEEWPSAIGLTARRENAEGSSGLREIHLGLSTQLSQRAHPGDVP